MIRYCDTSFVAPLVRKEATTGEVLRFLARFPAGELTISRWTEVEVASMLARDVRMGISTDAAARKADANFSEIVQDSFGVLSLDGGDYDLARRYLHTYETGLRAGDALHLAVAANRRAKRIYTFDKGMLRAGQLLGLPMSDGTGAD